GNLLTISINGGAPMTLGGGGGIGGGNSGGSANVLVSNPTSFDVRLEFTSSAAISFSVNVPSGASVDLQSTCPNNRLPQPSSLLLIRPPAALLLIRRRRPRRRHSES